MKLGVFSRVFAASPVEEKFRVIAARGFTAVQFKMSCAGLADLPGAIAPVMAARIGAAARTHRLALAALSGTFNMIHPDPAERKAGLRRLDVLAEAAPALGADLITLCTGTRNRDDMWRAHSENGRPEAWRDLLATLEAALEIAARRGVRLGVEPEPVNVVADAALCRRLLDAFPSPRLGVIFDPANLIRGREAGEDRRILDRALDLLGGRIFLVHAKDRNPEGEPVPAGHGRVDFPWLLPRLETIGFDGTVVLQPRTEAEVPEAAAYLRRIHAW